MTRRVVVTGLGLVTSIGSDVETFWEALLEGRSGIKPVASFDTKDYNVHIGGEVMGFTPDGAKSRIDLTQVGRASQFAIQAATRALKDAGIDPERFDPTRAGVSIRLRHVHGHDGLLDSLGSPFGSIHIFTV